MRRSILAHWIVALVLFPIVLICLRNGVLFAWLTATPLPPDAVKKMGAYAIRWLIGFAASATCLLVALGRVIWLCWEARKSECNEAS